MARDTLEFVSVQSETGEEGEGSRFLADLLRREGFDVTLDEIEPGRANVYARIPGATTTNVETPRWGVSSPHNVPSPHNVSSSPDASPRPDIAPPRTLLFNGHVDTIPVGASDPPARDGDWVVGRGAEDMKGGLVAVVHAVSALRKAGLQLAGDLWVTGVIGHETPRGKKEGPRRLIHLLRQREIRTDAILIAEGPCAIWTASLGSAMFTITIASERGPVHTINVPYEDNPARWLGRLLAAFEDMEHRFAASPRHPLCGREQLNVGIVRGGDYPNRLPTPATVSGTRRWIPGKTQQDVHAEFQALCDRLSAESGLAFTVSLQNPREPFETPTDHPVVRALQWAGETASGQTPEIIGLPLVGDANFYANEAGVPTVYYGPAYETAHSDHERVSIARLDHCAKVYALTAMTFCGTLED